MIYSDDLKKAVSNRKSNQQFLNKLKKLRPGDLDDQFHSLHHEVFEEVDCLSCANCCSTTSPIFQMTDIERLAKSFKMKSSEFIDQYLMLDEENDYVLKSSPCPFLGYDNKCIVYDDRPKACREYPHTNRKRMYQITGLTYKNTMVCPAVSRIVSRLKVFYG